jgi:hypothetical protein
MRACALAKPIPRAAPVTSAVRETLLGSAAAIRAAMMPDQGAAR